MSNRKAKPATNRVQCQKLAQIRQSSRTATSRPTTASTRSCRRSAISWGSTSTLNRTNHVETGDDDDEQTQC